MMYLRQVGPDEPHDPTMIGVFDIGVFAVGDCLRTHSGWRQITRIQPYDARTRCVEASPINQPPDDAVIHDLRESQVRNFWLNGIMSGSRAPKDCMTLDEARAIYERSMSDLFDRIGSISKDRFNENG